MKKLLTVAMALVIMVPALESCKKVSMGKLDGLWNVILMAMTIEYTDSDGDKTTYETDFNGSVETITTTYDEVDEPAEVFTETVDKTMSFEFAKKEGTYTQTTTEDRTWTNELNSYYTDDGAGNYSWSGYYDVETDRSQTTVANGTYSITGNTGDVKKNSQLVLTENGQKVDYTDTYTYFMYETTTVMDPDTMYFEDWDNMGNQVYTKLPKNSTGSMSTSGSNWEANVFNVDELKKGSLKMSFSAEETETDEDGDVEKETLTGNIEMEQE